MFGTLTAVLLPPQFPRESFPPFPRECFPSGRRLVPSRRFLAFNRPTAPKTPRRAPAPLRVSFGPKSEGSALPKRGSLLPCHPHVPLVAAATRPGDAANAGSEAAAAGTVPGLPFPPPWMGMPWPPLFGKTGKDFGVQPPWDSPLTPLLTAGFPPMPVPPAGFAGLTEEELRAMEGHDRQNLEARLQCLQNIHTLLDAAMVQINQYLTVLATIG